jgi:hypothetical protein
MNEVEFGGNEILKIYKKKKIKNSINKKGMYVV